MLGISRERNKREREGERERAGMKRRERLGEEVDEMGWREIGPWQLIGVWPE